MEKRIAVLNRERGPRGPLELRMSARFWSPKETITFSEFLDNVEGGCGFLRFHLPERLQSARRSMRLRKDDSNAAIAAKSCPAISALVG
jgi:hypothetical protein